jgi:hypothetical protein
MKYFCIILLLLILINVSHAQEIKVMGYERQTTINCIEDWLEIDPIEYEGAFSFFHSGQHTYSFTFRNGICNIEEFFESQTANEHSTLSNITIIKNKISALDSSGKEFNARFVKLKCEIDSDILSGFLGLLVNEELLYVMQGD